MNSIFEREFKAFPLVQIQIQFCIYIAHFLCEYIQMRFTTLCGGLCQTALWRSSQPFFNVTSSIHRCPQNRMSDARPQHRELHALLFSTSVWVL